MAESNFYDFFIFNNSYSVNKNSSNSRTYSDEIFCEVPNFVLYNTSGFLIAVPAWEAITSVAVLLFIIIGTVFGNVLVILGVFTHKPLRIVQNFFIVSLAVADLAVAILVMPLNVAYSTLGRWLWGKQLCLIWLTCDIMSCTSSILNLCVIALDRYWAITDPINYAHKRTVQRVNLQIAGIWILSLLISSPPLLGWNDWPEEFTIETPCQLTSERGYVLYSSFGSFFIPLLIMTIVYVKIYLAAKQRLRRRTLAARFHRRQPITNIVDQEDHQENKENSENDSISGDSINRCQRKAFMDMKKNLFAPLLLLHDPITRKEIGLDDDNTQTVQTNVVSGSRGSYRHNVVGTLKKLSQKKKKHEKPLLASIENSGDIVHKFIEQKQKISLSKERRAARTLGIIMGVFVICWLPFFLMYVILPFCSACCPTNKLINFITWLGYVNSAVNPIIYTIFNLDFRKAFKKLLGLSN